ncbi:hypothetical protein Hamer_G022089 [Homarus americanus]|uniref:Uncharacterized protein n=1 Tax=Homarus americanus TaxID=6706 RepID=A0A8J5JQM0_HOMAM|nr:hypothetical protein Hamer_G022089 [Homarus americanus]
MEALRDKGPAAVNKVTRKKHTKKSEVKNHSENTTNSKPLNLKGCKFCGRKHVWKKEVCPANGKTCSRCGKIYHFTIKCRATTNITVRGIQEDADAEDPDDQFVTKIAARSNDKAIIT